MRIRLIDNDSPEIGQVLRMAADEDVMDFADYVRDNAGRLGQGATLRIELAPPLPGGDSVPGAFRQICMHLRDLVSRDLTLECAAPAASHAHLRREMVDVLDIGQDEFLDEYRLGDARVLIRLGDLLFSQADALVNASNPQLKLGGGVSGAIRDAAGPGLQRELSVLASRRALQDGDAVMTPAFDISTAKWIIHVASVHASAIVVAKCIDSAMELCLQHGIRSVAFPALGTGVGGLELGEVARVIADRLRVFQRESGWAGTVEVYLWTTEDWATFNEAFGVWVGY